MMGDHIKVESLLRRDTAIDENKPADNSAISIESILLDEKKRSSKQGRKQLRERLMAFHSAGKPLKAHRRRRRKKPR